MDERIAERLRVELAQMTDAEVVDAIQSLVQQAHPHAVVGTLRRVAGIGGAARSRLGLYRVARAVADGDVTDLWPTLEKIALFQGASSDPRQQDGEIQRFEARLKAIVADRSLSQQILHSSIGGFLIEQGHQRIRNGASVESALETVVAGMEAAVALLLRRYTDEELRRLAERGRAGWKARGRRDGDSEPG